MYDHKNYDALIFSLINYNIMKNPLCEDEGIYYRKFVCKFVEEGREREEKSKMQKQKYAEKNYQKKHNCTTELECNKCQRLDHLSSSEASDDDTAL